MSKNESRRQRKQTDIKTTDSRADNRGGLSKVYYWVIGILFLILILLVVFIFSRSGAGDDVNLADKDNGAEVVQDGASDAVDDGTADDSADDENAETEAESAETETDAEAEAEDEPEEADDSEAADEAEADAEDEEDADTEDDATDIAPGETTTVDEDAPHDAGYAVNYNEGSADRGAIRSQVMQATGLGNDLIEWWVGNDGPGRVVATVSNPDRSEVYRVFLQYGDGSWHVRSYERLAAVPDNF